MVIDSSAALAILLGEADDETFADAIDADPTRIMSAVSALETSIVVEARKGPVGGRELDLLLHRGRIDVVPFNAHQLELARDAYRRFGKGYHRAALNFGDCCAYALASASGEPLLFKGNDFTQTDVPNALYRH
ncbi:MAG: type II toxin-antitoxin system VapC family toxin [Geminicoccaceae bacterium]